MGQNGILSPVRLPFRHTGNLSLQQLAHELTDGIDIVPLLWRKNE
jgi:hypothetical protein